MRIRMLAAAAFAAATLLALPRTAQGHGLVQRADLPIPEWLFGWAAAVVLIVSFVALAVLWPEPRLERDSWRPLPAGAGRLLTGKAVRTVCGVLGVAALILVLWAGLAGEQRDADNVAPTFVFVIFWIGLVLVSVLFGDVFRAFNPWLAIGRAAGIVVGLVRTPRKPRPYPAWLGRWPAVLGLLGFTWLELANETSSPPRDLAIAALVYSTITWAAMAAYGADRWADRGEAFSVYFNLLSRISPFESRDGEVGPRRWLSGLPRLEPLPGTVALLAVMIGTVTFDGLSQGQIWSDMRPELMEVFTSLGFGAGVAAELAATLGLASAVLVVYAFYGAGVAGARRVGRPRGNVALGPAFVHSLVPIAVAYVMAHYLTLLLFQGQAMGYLVSDPLGRGSDYFGTADKAIDYGVLGQNPIWYLQVGFVVVGHVLALTLAHDRALALYARAREGIRSQYWMLAVMVGFTSLALWLLAQANA